MNAHSSINNGFFALFVILKEVSALITSWISTVLPSLKTFFSKTAGITNAASASLLHPLDSRRPSLRNQRLIDTPCLIMSALLKSISGVCILNEAPSAPALVAKCGEVFIGLNIFWSTIWVAGVIDGIHPDKDIIRVEYLCPSQCIRQEKCIPSWHISYRDAF